MLESCYIRSGSGMAFFYYMFTCVCDILGFSQIICVFAFKGIKTFFLSLQYAKAFLHYISANFWWYCPKLMLKL